MEQSKKTSFVQGAAILGIAGLIVKLLGAIFRIPLLNLIGTERMAYYQVAYPIYAGLLVISSAGLPTAISKLVSERLALGDPQGAKRVFSAALKLLVGIGIVTTILLFAFSGVIGNAVDRPIAKYSFVALSPALFFVSVMCAYRGYLQGMQRMTGTAISQIIEQLVKFILGYALAAILFNKYPDRIEVPAIGALAGVSISELAALIFIKFYFTFNLKRGNLPISLRGTELMRGSEQTSSILKKLLVIAIPITIGASVMPLTALADSALILGILTDKFISVAGMTLEAAEKSADLAFGLLTANINPLINMPAVLTLALSMSLVPAISQAVAKRDRRTVHNASATGLKLALFIGAPCAVGLFVLGGPIMETLLYRGSLGASQELINGVKIQTVARNIMRFASVGVLFLSIVQTLTGIIQGMGKPRIPVFFLAIGGAVKVISMIVLMKFTDMGILGAALSTVLCYAIAAIGDIFFVLHYTQMRISCADTFIKPLFSSVLMGVIVYFVYKLISGMGYPSVGTVLAIGAGVVVYLGAMMLLRPFNANDLEFLPKANLFAKLFRVKMK
ncbi:MAG: polysaccharide biosynthesis protein [Clostridia bacterium]|nr:polysaccharide biosynthesis protein [Clostridia bacterium]